MRFSKLLVFSLVFAGFLLAGTAAKADTLTLSLDSPYQIGSQPLFYFDGTIAYTESDSATNAGATEYLNGDSLVGDTGLTLDDSPFSTNAPTYMNPGDTWTGLLFTVAPPSYGLGSNLYTGSFTILGGNDDPTTDGVLATANFDVQVTPEPSSFLLLVTGLFGVVEFARRKRAAFIA